MTACIRDAVIIGGTIPSISPTAERALSLTNSLLAFYVYLKTPLVLQNFTTARKNGNMF